VHPKASTDGGASKQKKQDCHACHPCLNQA
jgi:hypothetical protein